MESQAAKLRGRLQKIDAVDAELIRRRIIETLRDFVPSHVGLFVKCVELDGQPPHFTSVVCLGDDEVRRELLEYAEKPAFMTPWLPPHLDPDEVNNFIRTRKRYQEDNRREFEPMRKLFKRLRVQEQLRAIVTDDHRILGWLGLLRRDPASPFTRRHKRLLDTVIDPIIFHLRRAEQRDGEMIDTRHCALYQPEGVTEYHSSSWNSWVTSDRRRRLQACIQRIDEEGEEHRADIIDGAEVDVLRLDSPTDQRRYLVSLRRPRLLTIDPACWLTKRQREVARYVMSGATSPEIAEELHVSVETVKSHIKNIFDRLNISSRAELAAILSATDVNGAPD